LLKRNDLTPVRVCDVGCGAGEILVQLQQHLGVGAKLHGYDISLGTKINGVYATELQYYGSC
jgi:ubiquinone/menaquinone biosynthesis C-methylase UbiE